MTATAGCHPPVLMGVQGLGAAPVWPADIPQGVTFFPPGAGEMLPSLALLPGGTAAGSKARRCNAKLDTVTGRAAVLWVQLQPPPAPAQYGVRPQPLLAEKPSPARSSWARRVHTGEALEGSGDVLERGRGGNGGARPGCSRCGGAARRPLARLQTPRRRANCASVCSPGSR